MGTSGSGKSTFMNMLGTLDKPNSGSYYLDGIDMLHLDSDRLAMVRCEKMGFVFQGFNLISRTSALDNVMLPMIYKGISEEERIKRAEWALKLSDFKIEKTTCQIKCPVVSNNVLQLLVLLLMMPH